MNDSPPPGQNPGPQQQGPGQPGRPPVNPRPTAPPPPPPGYTPPPYAAPQPPRGRRPITAIITAVFGTLAGIILSISLLLNLYLGIFFISMMDMPVMESTYRKGTADKRIVVLPIEGMIDDTQADFIHNAMRSLRNNTPGALVVRVESGGGGVSASDAIWHELYQFRQDHPDVPVLASFGSVAASGGYYVASPAESIYAEPTSITGSIGVMAINFTIGEMMESLGIQPNVQVADQSPQKDVANDLFRPWDEQDKAKIQVLLDFYYDIFIDRIATGRTSITEEQLKDAANGNIFTAPLAKEKNLIDEIGFLDDAVAEAEQRAGIAAGTAPVAVLKQPDTFGLFSALGWQSPSWASWDADHIRETAHDLASPQVMYMTDWR